MKRLYYILLLVPIWSCNDVECGVPTFTAEEVQLEADIQAIDEYLALENIEAEVHPSGMRYVIVDIGDTKADKANDCSDIFVLYKGTLLDGSVFDQRLTDFARFDLNSVIPGWRMGIPLIYEEGVIQLYIPSGFGYGTAGAGDGIPPNSPLIFEITLLAAENYLN